MYTILVSRTMLRFSIGSAASLPLPSSSIHALFGSMDTPSSFLTRSFIVAMLSTSMVTLKFSIESFMLSSVDSNNALVAEEGSRSIICSPFNSLSVTIAWFASRCVTAIAHTR